MVLGLRSKIENIPETDRERMSELKEQISEAIDLIVFEVKNGNPLKGRCDICRT
jgi:Flp pilus assembly protein TadB